MCTVKLRNYDFVNTTEKICNTFNRPCCLSDSVSYTTSQIPEERKRFAEQGAKDWEQILLHRSTELKKGYALRCCISWKIFCTINNALKITCDQGNTVKQMFHYPNIIIMLDMERC